MHQCSPDLSYQQTEKQAKKYISRKNWRACEKLTYHTHVTESIMRHYELYHFKGIVCRQFVDLLATFL